jgi:HAE1 family hydrophobic/amphiphilic exporter-1
MNKFEDNNIRSYKNLLGAVLANKTRSWLVVITSFVLFFITMFVFGPKLGFEFLPSLDDGKIRVTVEMPQGYNLDETAKLIRQVEDRIKKHPEVVHMLTDLGKKSGSTTDQ